MVHPNVGSAFAALSQRNEDEEKKYKELFQKAYEEQRFFKCFAGAFFVPCNPPLSFSGEWRSDDGSQFPILQDRATIVAEWIQGEDKHVLSGLVANRGSKIGLKISSGKGGTIALLLSGTKESAGYAYLSNDNREMHWMLAKDSEFTFRQFARIS